MVNRDYIVISEQAQTKDINFNIGVEAGINFTQTTYTGGGGFFYIDRFNFTVWASG